MLALFSLRVGSYGGACSAGQTGDALGLAVGRGRDTLCRGVLGGFIRGRDEVFGLVDVVDFYRPRADCCDTLVLASRSAAIVRNECLCRH